MKSLLLAWALAMPALSWAGAPPGITSKTSSAAAVDGDHRALALLDACLTPAQELQAVRLRGAAPRHRCGKAALARAMPLLEQAAGEGNRHAAELFFNLFDQRTAVAGEAAPASYQQARTAPGAIDFRVTVDVLERQGCAFAQITHHNVGLVAMYFEPLEPLLRIRDASGRPLAATGIIADGPPLLPEDYVKLLPGANLMREVALNRSYALTSPGTYKLELNGNYYDPRLLKDYAQGGNIVRTFKYAGLCQKVLLE